ncbi:MAG: YchJ family metal-binding protein [Marmoricola sp.]
MVFPSGATTQVCPCDTGAVYRTCCGPLHDGDPAATALALMRSRYSAYALDLADYVFRTWHPRTRPVDLPPTSGVMWVGLEILATVAGGVSDDTGTVEFRAQFRNVEGQHSLRETSRFTRRAGQWVYVDAEAAEHD